MPRVDKQRFPKLIVEIPVEQFPTELKIMMRGTNMVLSKTAELVASSTPVVHNFSDSPAGEPFFISDKDFKDTSPDGKKKIAKLKTPFNVIYSTSGWAKRENPEDTTKIEIFMYTTTENGIKSTNGQSGLEGVWAYRMTLQKQALTPAYCVDYIVNGTEIGQIGSTVGQLVSQGAGAVSEIMNPKLPTPQAIASKLLGPAAAGIQGVIAQNAQILAQVKPKIDLALSIATAIQNIIKDPKSAIQYLPIIFNFLFEFIPKEELEKVIFAFKG